MSDSSDGEVEVRRLQPYQATKAYICPGCNQDIPAGTGRLVIIPAAAPDLRRHWHHACWRHRHRRRPGRSRPR
ncbi:MAG TPA: hypothetical protein VK306_00690 [Acidimicrobiales bacterium]|nr:hypothetical protein [Acidimicrobiales bacterium]